jgi:hypothetical protein
MICIDQHFNDTGIENYKLSQKRPCAIKYCKAENVYLCSNYLFLHVLCLVPLWLTADILQTPESFVPLFIIYRPTWARLIEMLRKYICVLWYLVTAGIVDFSFSVTIESEQ